MNLNLRALAAFLRDVCQPCRPVDDLMAVADATAESPWWVDCGRPADPEPEPELPSPIYHAVVSEMAEALADLRAPVHGAADWAAWSAELAAEGADE